MNEYIDIVTKEGKPTGKSELKSIIHQEGYYHHTAHIWFYNKKGEVLLSQRSAKKRFAHLCGMFQWQDILMLEKRQKKPLLEK